MTTHQSIISEAIAQFEVHQRDDGTHYVAFSLGSIEESNDLHTRLSSLIANADGSTDFAYTTTLGALDHLGAWIESNPDSTPQSWTEESGGADEFAEDTPVYTYDLLQWLASNISNASLVDDAVSEYGYSTLTDAITQAIAMTQRSIAVAVAEVISETLSERNA